jgi:general secretion pathway protein I
MMQCEQHIQGYTLIEVLVAMTILAMSLTVIFRIFSTGLVNVDVASDYARAVLVAEGRLAESGFAGLHTGKSEGAVDERFYWLRTVENFVMPIDAGSSVSNVQPLLVTVSVEWEHRGRMRRVDLRSVRLAAAGDGAY